MVPGGGPARPPGPRDPGRSDQASLPGLLRDINDLAQYRAAEARYRFHLVLIPEGGHATCREYTSVDQLAAAVRPVIGQQGQVFVFFGDRWHLTRGPLKFLVPPAGDRLPLFQDAAELDVDPTGSTSLDGAPADGLPAGVPPAAEPFPPALPDLSGSLDLPPA